MSRTPLIWGAGLLCSLALHVGAGAVLLRSVEPEPVVHQPVPETRMQLSAHQVKQSQAVEAQPDARPANAQDTSGARLNENAIPQNRASAAEPPSQQVTASAIEPTAALAVESPAARLDTIASEGEPIRAEVDTPDLLPAVTGKTVALTEASFSVSTVTPQTAAAQTVAPATLNAEVTAAIPSEPVVLREAEPKVSEARASDVFAATGDDPIDPVSLAAFQSFTRPEDVGQVAQDMRDGIDALLSQVPCARLNVQFQPETNTLELIGHIPEDGLRSPVLSALQARMGENIQVADNLLILPRPQCNALGGIADVGLPQSTDQITNPLLVGEDVFTRQFQYRQGQQLVMDLTGADYDSYVYVDYFDADGQVIHLSPNDSTPLTLTPAKSALRIGADTPGDPGLFITIGPPFGQEIAVAFAASRPLYQGNRLLVEPADTYLDFLREQVAKARADDPEFKGEWVYFFITTSPE